MPAALASIRPPSLSVVIPTAGRATLARCLASIRPQLRNRDEVIVVGDVLHGALPASEATVRRCGSRFRYVPFTDGRMTWGHAQCNAGLALAGGDYVLCQDDDDVYEPGAFDAIRRAATRAPGRPLLFRFRSYHGGQVFWHTPGVVKEGALGGHCLVSPNVPGRVGRLTDRYQGDFDWIADTLARWEPVEPAWVDHIIATARPETQRQGRATG